MVIQPAGEMEPLPVAVAKPVEVPNVGEEDVQFAIAIDVGDAESVPFLNGADRTRFERGRRQASGTGDRDDVKQKQGALG